MKPRDLLNFFKTKSGKLVAFGALFAAALVIFSVVRKQHGTPDLPVTALSTNVTDKPQVVQSVILVWLPPLGPWLLKSNGFRLFWANVLSHTSRQAARIRVWYWATSN